MGAEPVHAPLAAANVADIAAPATKQTNMDSPFNRCVSDPFHGDPSAPWRSSLGVKHLPRGVERFAIPSPRRNC
jgi:hypothetical protein